MWESCAVIEAFPNYGSTLSNAKKTHVLLIVSTTCVEILKMKMPPPLCEVVSSLNRKITPVAFWVMIKTHHSGGRTLHSVKARASPTTTKGKSSFAP
jgi:hypothetical protein